MINLNHRDSSACITPTSSIDGLKEAFTPLSFERRSSRLSTPIGSMPPLSFSEAVSVSADPQQTQQKQTFQSTKVRDPQSPASGSMSPLSNFGMNGKELEDDLMDSFLGFSATPSPVGSSSICIGPKNMTATNTITTTSTSTSTNSNVVPPANNNSNNSTNNADNNGLMSNNSSSTSRFIMRQTNGTHVAVGQNRAVTYNSVLCLEPRQMVMFTNRWQIDQYVVSGLAT